MMIVLILACAVVIGTLCYGLVSNAKGDIENNKKAKRALKINLATFIPVMMAALILVVPNAVLAATGDATSASGLKYIGMALSTGLACIGAGYSVGAVGSSAIGAISENPKLLGKTMIYIGLGEGIAIYGIIISILIMIQK